MLAIAMVSPMALVFEALDRFY